MTTSPNGMVDKSELMWFRQDCGLVKVWMHEPGVCKRHGAPSNIKQAFLAQLVERWSHKR